MMKRGMVVLGMVFLCSPVLRAEDPVYFPDAHLKQEVEYALGKTNPTPTDMLRLTLLSATGWNITDLTGLEYATNLTEACLWNNQISDISPLAGLTNLTHLDLAENQISDISPLAGLTNLTRLALYENQISDLSPLAGLTNLTYLHLWFNPLNPEACNVYIPKIISNNPGIDISYSPCPPVYFADAKLKYAVEQKLGKPNPTAADMLGLTSLLAGQSDITDLTGLEYATKLTVVDLSWNQISDISPLAGLTNLIDLVLGLNQISDLSPLAGLTNLTGLDLYGNQISDISPLAGLTNLASLKLNGNQISDISALAGLTNLTYLNLRVNPLNPEACNVYIPKIGENNPGITIDYDPCPEEPVHFADANLKTTVEAVLHKTDPTPTDMLGLTSLTAQAGGVTDLTGLEYATNLTHLDLAINEISDLSPLAGLTNLTSLQLFGNEISDLSPLGGLTNLTDLDLHDNQISDLSPLAGFMKLTSLDLRGNPLNQEACNVYIPKIGENNPDISIRHDSCKEATVPDVVGMTQAEAEAAVIAAGFKVGTVWCGPSELPEGTVYTQNPAGGETAPPGSAVDLTVAQVGSGPTVPGTGYLMAHWKLDEAGGEVAFDSAGQNDGVTYGQPLWQPAGGQLGGALELDGVDDYAQLPIGPVISALTDSTFATWVNWSGGPDGQRIFDFGGGPVNMFLTPCAAGVGRMRFAITETGAQTQDQATAPQALAAGWHHVAVTIDAADQTYVLYLDGQAVATKTDAQYTPSSLGATTQNWLGRSRSSADPYFHGALDDFRIYGCALRAAEVAQLAAEVPPDPSLLGWWKLDETWGSIALDSSGSDHHAMLLGGPLWQPAGGRLGGALQFDGVDDYAQLPIGALLGALTDSTFATWVNWSGTGGDGQRVFDFGSSASVNMFFTPRDGQTGFMRFAITNAGQSGQDRITTAQALGTGWHHVAVTIDAARRTYLLYVDGRVVGGKSGGQYTPSSLGGTTRNWLGRSQWSADPYFNGALDDFRIYGRVLSGAEIAQLTPGAAGYPILMLDFSTSNVATQTEAGFTSFTLADSGSTIDGIKVELAGNLGARWRGAPTGIPYELVYRDFIYARPGGMTVTLSGLVANAAYEITIYAYDTSSTTGGDRIADWTANGQFCLTAGFTASLAPVAADDYAFTGMAQADSTGKIVLEAGPNVNTTEQSGATNPFAFLNGLVISSAEP